MHSIPQVESSPIPFADLSSPEHRSWVAWLDEPEGFDPEPSDACRAWWAAQDADGGWSESEAAPTAIEMRTTSAFDRGFNDVDPDAYHTLGRGA